MIRGIERVTGETYDPETGTWHYGDAGYPPWHDDRHQGAGSWPPIYPGPASGEGCAR